MSNIRICTVCSSQMTDNASLREKIAAKDALLAECRETVLAILEWEGMADVEPKQDGTVWEKGAFILSNLPPPAEDRRKA